MAPTKWTVKGKHRCSQDDERWAAFEETYTAQTRGEARWKARRDKALGEPLAKLEAQPPNPEREGAEVEAPTSEQAKRIEQGGARVPFVSDRTEVRKGAEVEEYERLTHTVRITSVEPA